jgi:hypothetical protein
MPENNESIEQVAREIPSISVPVPVIAVVLPLALWGAQDLTRKTVNKITDIVQDRKTRPDLKVVQDASAS